MKVSNIKNGKRVSVTHGELYLLPVSKVPKGKSSEHSMFVLAHSETGHNHVLQAEPKTTFTVTEVGDAVERFLSVSAPVKLVHQKTFDVHQTRVLAPGDYRVYYKQEYDIREKVMRAVFD